MRFAAIVISQTLAAYDFVAEFVANLFCSGFVGNRIC